MDLNTLQTLSDDANVLIHATEDWADSYRDDKEIFRNVVKAEQDFESAMFKYFTGLAGRAMGFVNWAEYRQKIIRAYDVVVEQDQSQWDEESQILLKVVFPELAKTYLIGLLAGVKTYRYEPGTSLLESLAQQAAMEHAAELIGMKRNPQTGGYELDPAADKGLIQTTREKVRQSIQTSLALGEDNEQAANRLMEFIDSKSRALMIARTEAVSAFNKGMMLYGKQTGAVGKVWNVSYNPCPICENNGLQGEIAFDQEFDSGDLEPQAHPNCMCGLSLTFADSTNLSMGDDGVWS